MQAARRLLHCGSPLTPPPSYAFDKAIKYHLSYRTLADHLKAISAKRVILTHLGSDLLGHLDEVAADVAYDGLMVTIDDD